MSKDQRITTLLKLLRGERLADQELGMIRVIAVQLWGQTKDGLSIRDVELGLGVNRWTARQTLRRAGFEPSPTKGETTTALKRMATSEVSAFEGCEKCDAGHQLRSEQLA